LKTSWSSLLALVGAEGALVDTASVDKNVLVAAEGALVDNASVDVKAFVTAGKAFVDTASFDTSAVVSAGEALVDTEEDFFCIENRSSSAKRFSVDTQLCTTHNMCSRDARNYFVSRYETLPSI
jgi:carbonic anhydrase/acetyltransferase-like protein (isoleucine patch superfamily)